jgi:hypothetical protein
VGRGETYTNVAQRLRRGAWGPGAGALRRAVTTVESGQTVADWVAAFTPVVAEAHQEARWPQTIVCDSTRFMYTDRWTGQPNQLFCVLAVWGYEEGDATGRLYRLVASPDQDAAAWKSMLESLPGKPELVVCDRDYGIIGGVQAAWGRGRAGVPVHLCEHHLYERAKMALADDKVTGFEHPLHVLLNDAFKSLEGWQAFYEAATATGGATAKWARHWDKRMTAQTRRRPSIPPHYANGAIEDPIRQVRQMLERRSWTFRNLKRMNLLLELVRLRVNGVDSEAAYSRTIRQHLAANGGRPATDWRAVRDPRRTDKRVSTSSLRAWIA